MNQYIQLDLQHPAFTARLTLSGRGVTAIVGVSGSGKTTLLRAIAGLESAAIGVVQVNGVVWQDDARHVRLAAYQRPVGFVFQEASLFPHLSVQGNLEFALRRTPRQLISLPKITELLGLGSLLARDPATLSGGERQRVAIARALACSPQLMLMDEPLASLDEPRKAEILPYLERLTTELSVPILYVSHAISEVVHLADNVVVLEAGKVRACGGVFEVLSRPDLPFAHGDHAFALVSARMINYEAAYQLSQFDFAGGSVFLPQSKDSLAAVGSLVRLRIQARDVSISLTPQLGSSILNSIQVKILAITQDRAGLYMLELAADETHLLSRITQKSLEQLNLKVGMSVYAQIKGVAILR